MVCDLETEMKTETGNENGNDLRIGIRIDLRISPIWSANQDRHSPRTLSETSGVSINTRYFPISGYRLRIRKRM